MNPWFQLPAVYFPTASLWCWRAPLSSFPHFLKFIILYLVVFLNPFLPPPFSLSLTLTVHLRNPAFSAVPWCLVATWFSLPRRLLLLALIHPLATFQPFLLLPLPNLAPTPLPTALLALQHLLPPLHTFSSPLRLNLVMHGKGDEHLLEPRLVGQAASSPLQCLTSNYTKAWAFLPLRTSLPPCLPASLSSRAFLLDL